MKNDIDSAMAHLQAGRWAEGVAGLSAVVAVQSRVAELWSNLAFGLRQLGRASEARDAAQRAVALKPALADAWNLLGLAEQDLTDFDAAAADFQRAIQIRPQFAQAWMNLANCDQARGRVDEAIERYRRSLEIDPRQPELHYNLGHLHHKALGDYTRAIAHYRDAIALDPGYATAHHNLSHALFLAGRFEEAWVEHAWRPARRTHAAALASQGRTDALPDPETLAGRHLVVVGEQGLGDMLFHLRFAPLLRSRGARLDFAGEPRLHAMLARTGLFDRVAATAVELEREGSQTILAGDLALLVPEARAVASVPAPLALAPLPERLAAMQARLAALGPAPHVAIAWRAGVPRTGLFETLFKQVPLEVLCATVRGIPGTVVGVQRGPLAGEIDALANLLGRAVHDLSDTNADLEDALAVMALVDESIGVSNTNVHLRAGTGRTARVFVPMPYEWRWMSSGASPWFPGTAVLREHRGAAPAEWSAAPPASSAAQRSQGGAAPASSP